ncbi:MAG: GNAT family N-acetyltransferase [Burkholderiales bacterium]|nr:MAG: GNAT family N-acetyltransferase [Burkholderiales bacterium]
MNLRLDSAGAEALLVHLRAADVGFVPPLSSRVDLAGYAAKLAAHARRVEAWDGDTLVGLIAMYANEPAQGGFITNVSVLPTHHGRGIAGELLRRTLTLAAELRLARLRLEVYADNTAALALYRRHGFEAEAPAAPGPTLFLHREL